MMTRCPACGTGFRVSAGQLKAQHGTVRCGRCSEVFNAFDTLYTLPGARQETEAPRGSAPERTASDAAALSAGVREDFHDAAAEEAPPPATEPEPPAEHSPAPTGGQAGLSETRATGIPALRQRPGVWAAGSGVLLLVLLTQLVFVFRTDIADAQPGLRSWLEQICARLGCTVPYPQNIQQWSIESSDLQSDPEEPARMTLTAVLRNRASFTQSYPALELTLTDTQDRAVARRVLGAADYLPPDAKGGPGLGPNSEVTLRLAMDTGELGAAGYRLYLFYP